MSSTPWDDAVNVATLTRLWGLGLSTKEIAAQIPGATRNSVIAKAHRLKLAGRESPIIRTNAMQTSRQSQPRPRPRPIRIPPAPVGQITQPGVVLEPKPKSPDSAKVQRYAAHGSSGRRCAWPIGSPKDEGFHFCEARAVVDRPYCALHCAKAYV